MMFYSMGLSGFFFDYPFVLMLVIFLVLAVPLILIALKFPKSPQWNIVELWLLAALMIVRSLGVLFLPSGGEETLGGEELPVIIATLAGTVAFSLGWAFAWTKYFSESVRVRNTFS
jgi:hypothetical protein